MTTKLICLVGADGTGKTTVARRLVNKLCVQGCPAKYVWFRFPRILTLPLLFVSKITKFTSYRKEGNICVVSHSFDKAPFSMIYPFFMLIDVLLSYLSRVWLPQMLGYVVVCDRWISDIIVDTAIDTHNLRFIQSSVGKIFYRFSQKANLLLLFDAPDSILDQRRPETQFDKTTHDRRSFYRSIVANNYKVALIRSDVTPSAVWKHLLAVMEEKKCFTIKKTGESKVYASVKSPWLRRFLKNKCFQLASNWLVQGVLIRVWSERCFRFIFGCLFTIIFFIPLNVYLSFWNAAILAIISAHTINWTLNGNGNLMEALSQYSKDNTIKKINYLKELSFETNHGIAAILAFGSLSRGEFTRTSDLDITVIRKSGVGNWAKVNVAAFFLRLNAFIKGLPVDLYILDNVCQLQNRVRSDEKAVVVFDEDGLLSGLLNVIPLNAVFSRFKVVTNGHNRA